MSSPTDHPTRRQKLWRHARYPRQWWLLLRIAGWYGLLHILRIRLKTEGLIRWAILVNPPQSANSARSSNDMADILQYLGWINAAGAWLPVPANNCLVRALVGCRFLMQVGEKPTLIIGFHGPQGHAWLELAGQPLEQLTMPYQPTLQLNHRTHRLEPLNTPKYRAHQST